MFKNGSKFTNDNNCCNDIDNGLSTPSDMTCIILEVDTMPTGSCFETIAVSNKKAFHSNNSNSLQSAAVSNTLSRLISQRNGLNLILYGNNYNGFPVIIV